MPVVLVVSFLWAALLGLAAMGATSMRAVKVLAGSCLVLIENEINTKRKEITEVWGSGVMGLGPISSDS